MSIFVLRAARAVTRVSGPTWRSIGEDRRRCSATLVMSYRSNIPAIAEFTFTDLGVTSIYLQGIDNAEIINAVHGRKPPMMPASAMLRL